jgi:hypothetical protein
MQSFIFALGTKQCDICYNMALEPIFYFRMESLIVEVGITDCGW